MNERQVTIEDKNGGVINCVLFTPPRSTGSSNTVYCTECPAMLRVMEASSVDLAITSPPYAERRKKAYGGIPADEYVEWFLPISAELYRVLKPTGSFVLNIKESVDAGERQNYALKLVLALQEQGWLWVDEFIWHKTNPFPTGNKNRLKDGFERCYHFSKTKKFKFFPDAVRTKSTSKWAGDSERRKNKGAYATKNGSGMNMSRRIVGDLVRPSNVVTLPSSSINIDHPAVYPVELPEFFVKLMTEPGDLVLDPFMGSGSTALAARGLGRRYEGVECSEDYLFLCAKRLARTPLWRNGKQVREADNK
jgi:site-specific DNA-methyltransferase (adenine-specific)